MKTLRLWVFLILAGSGHLTAQNSITLSFSATLNGAHLPLDSISIRNLTQAGDTSLYGSDSVLVLYSSIGIPDPGHRVQESLILYPAFPNPFTGTTTTGFFLPQQEEVTLSLYDLHGRKLTRFAALLPAGEHRFRVNEGSGKVCLLSVETRMLHQVQKLVPFGHGKDVSRIEYAGWQPGIAGLRKTLAPFPWAPGDNLRFIGYTSNGTDTIDAQPVLSTHYIFQYLPQAPPPTALFTASDTTVYMNDTVYFTDLSLHTPTTWKWLFGDGMSSQQQNPFHIYTTPGSFTVTLIAGNASGHDTLTRINYITVSVFCPPTVVDISGNVYNTVAIGSQCWMKENLKARSYSNGLPIPNIADNTSWAGLTTGARCWYNNDSASYAATYGALYNWFAVANGNLCPAGWHVPDDAEWTVLTDFVGGLSVAGIHLKEAGTSHWNSPNSGANNSSGFTALPGGARSPIGSFAEIGNSGYWWSSTPSSATQTWIRNLSHNMMGGGRGSLQNPFGLSVRCVRN